MTIMESSGFFNCADREKEEPSDESRVENNREKTEEKSDLRDPRENSSDILQICGVIRESELAGEKKIVIEYEDVQLNVNSLAVSNITNDFKNRLQDIKNSFEYETGDIIKKEPLVEVKQQFFSEAAEESNSNLDRELNNDVEIVFQDEDLKSQFYSSVVKNIAIHSPNHSQNVKDSNDHNDENIIKVESMVEVKQQLFDDAEEESNLNPKCELVEQINIDTVDDRCINHSCDICGKDLLSTNYLQAHIHSVHGGLSRRCGNCGKIFARLSNLLMHVKTHRVNIR